MRDKLPETLGYAREATGQVVAIRLSPIRHESLTQDQLRRIAKLRDALIDAYPMTLDGWIDGFMRDMHPEKEISIIEACAVVYQRVTDKKRLPDKLKREIYGLIVSISAGLPCGDPKRKIAKDLPSVGTIVEMYREARNKGERL